ncbi:MAG: HAMP domain-containing sensor histidine kinase [Bacteroidota bacterium]
MLRDVTRALDLAIARPTPDGTLALNLPVPSWLARLWPYATTTIARDASLFLDDFLTQAEVHWASAAPQPLWSEPWTESGPDGGEVVLEAAAMTAQGQALLLLRQAQTSAEDTRHVLQESRSQALEMRRLMHEVNKREVLLHCIIHDLSTPLAGIKGSLTLLQQDQLVDAEGDELLAIALRQTERLQTQIRDVVRDFARDVKAVLPTLTSNEAPADIHEIAADALQAIRPIAEPRQVALALDADGHAPWTVRGDAGQLARVLQNMLDNALRFTPPNSTLTVRLSQTDAEIQVGVLDEGPGVAPQLQPHLFDRFSQGDRDAGTAGLGLFFCRITVERIGGHVGYRDRPGDGACFWFTLPRTSP